MATQTLREYDGSGTLKMWYTYGNYVDEVLSLYDEGASALRFYAHDHLYSPAALLDSGGDVIERYEYDAYGNPYILEPNFAVGTERQVNLPVALDSVATSRPICFPDVRFPHQS